MVGYSREEFPEGFRRSATMPWSEPPVPAENQPVAALTAVLRRGAAAQIDAPLPFKGQDLSPFGITVPLIGAEDIASRTGAPCGRLHAQGFFEMASATTGLFTIGHSAHPLERFIALLRGANVTAIADVRTAPYSRRHPHFNREDLRAALRAEAIAYVFLGKELGGRPSARRFYREGVADYEKMAQEKEFSAGLDRVLEGATKYRVALMCSERDPLDCHRCLLASRALVQRGARVDHILDDGTILSHSEIEDRLLENAGRNAEDLFAPRAERLATAYRAHARKVAFPEPPDGSVATQDKTA
jgi:hypothetical protein